MPSCSVNPVTGEVLKTLNEHTDEEMMSALATADKAAKQRKERNYAEGLLLIKHGDSLLPQKSVPNTPARP